MCSDALACARASSSWISCASPWTQPQRRSNSVPNEFIGSISATITLGIRVKIVAATSSGSRANSSGRQSDRRPGFEQARDELIELVKRLEAGGLTLEQSLQLWERGEQLATICEEWLEGARARMATALARQEEQDEAPAAPF